MTWQSSTIDPASTTPASDISKIKNDLQQLRSVIGGGTDTDIPVTPAYQHGYNALRHVSPTLWAAIFNGTSTDDHTAALIAANTAALAAGQPLYLPGKRWNYKPTAPLETKTWHGDGKHHTALYVDCSTYTATNVVFRSTGGCWHSMTIREASNGNTRGIMMQLSDTTALTGAGGSLSFTGYIDLRDIWILGGLIALDIGNVFTCTFTACRFINSGTGVNIVPANDAGDNGYANTLTFINCEVADNGKNWNVNATGGKLNTLQILGGSMERATTTSSFTNVAGLDFDGVYLEQSAAVSPMALNGCTGVYLKANTPGVNCDVTLGSNTEIVIDGWNSGSNHLIGANGTQVVTIRNSTFPATGNSAPSAFAKCTIENSSYNGKAYGYRSTAQRLTKPTGVDATIATIASAATIAPTDPITKVSGTAAITTITAPAEFEYGGQITLLPTGAWTLATGGNIMIASTAVSGKAMTLTYDTNTARWFPSY